MPGGDGRRMRLLDEERAGVDQEIGAEQVLDRVQDARVLRQLGCPGQDQVRHGPPFHLGDAVDRPAEPSLEPLQPVAAGLDLRGVQKRERREKSVTPPSGDLLLAQDVHRCCLPPRDGPCANSIFHIDTSTGNQTGAALATRSTTLATMHLLPIEESRRSGFFPISLPPKSGAGSPPSRSAIGEERMASARSFVAVPATPLLDELTHSIAKRGTPGEVLDALNAFASKFLPAVGAGSRPIPDHGIRLALHAAWEGCLSPLVGSGGLVGRVCRHGKA